MIVWITSSLGTAAYAEGLRDEDVRIVDVRDMVDRTGNLVSTIDEKIADATRLLEGGARVVICCDQGFSRSNAVAAGVIARQKNISFHLALDLVTSRTGHKKISVEVLSAVRAAVENTARPSGASGDSRVVLVTGATGFIGTKLLKNVHPEVSVVAPRRRDANLAESAVDLDSIAKEKGVDTIVHLANPRVYGTTASLGESLTMLENVLEVCGQNALRLITLSSWEIYSGNAAAQFAAEDAPVLPRSTYGRAKALGELLIDLHARTRGLKYTLLRVSPVYGPGSDKPKFLHYFLDKASRGEVITTHRYANGTPHLDLIHVDDVVAAIGRAIRSDHQGSVNIGTGVATGTDAIADIVRGIVGSRSPIVQRSIEGNAPHVAMDTRLAADALGWHPTIDLRDGIRLLWEARS